MMREEERLGRWENYPDVPNGISEAKREIKDIGEISVECHFINVDICPTVDECADIVAQMSCEDDS